MRKLVRTSIGTIEIGMWKGYGTPHVIVFDDDGWEKRDVADETDDEFEWSEKSLAETLARVGLPMAEADEISRDVWREWLARGGGPMSRVENVASSLGALLFILLALGGGVAFVWIIVKVLL